MYDLSLFAEKHMNPKLWKYNSFCKLLFLKFIDCCMPLIIWCLWCSKSRNLYSNDISNVLLVFKMHDDIIQFVISNIDSVIKNTNWYLCVHKIGNLYKYEMYICYKN